MGNKEKLLEMQSITKRFGGVTALENVSFDLYSGEVHVLAGENGAGKSTLLKTLSGMHSPDFGFINVRETRYDSMNTRLSQDLGIQIIYQEFSLVPDLSIMENISLGSLPRYDHLPLINWDECYSKTNELLSELNLKIDPRELVGNLPVAEQQMVEIAKALSRNATIIAMDEPTSALSQAEVDNLFKFIDQLKGKGVGIIYISHKLDEVKQIGDRVTVLRNGKNIITDEAKNMEIDEIIRHMIGRDVSEQYPKTECFPTTDRVLKVKNITRTGKFKDIDFTAFGGEIVGISGLVGSGRTEIIRAIFGADAIDMGEIELNNRCLKLESPRDGIREGIALVPENRKTEGLAIGMSIRNNITISSLRHFVNRGVLKAKKERQTAQKYIDRLRIKTPDMFYEVNSLSGGNQQKVVFAKWLCSQADIFLFDEPTRGVDVGAKVEIYDLMQELANNGAIVIMVSSELPEIIGMSDRVIVVHEGRITGHVCRGDLSETRIMLHATDQVVTRVPSGLDYSSVNLGLLALSSHSQYFEGLSEVSKDGSTISTIYIEEATPLELKSALFTLRNSGIDGIVLDDSLLPLYTQMGVMGNLPVFIVNYQGIVENEVDALDNLYYLGTELPKAVSIFKSHLTDQLEPGDNVLVLGEKLPGDTKEDLMDKMKQALGKGKDYNIIEKRVDPRSFDIDVFKDLSDKDIKAVIACTDSLLKLTADLYVKGLVPGSIILCGFGGSKESLSYVWQDVVSFMLDFFPAEVGRAALEVSARVNAGEKMPDRNETGRMIVETSSQDLHNSIFGQELELKNLIV